MDQILTKEETVIQEINSRDCRTVNEVIKALGELIANHGKLIKGRLEDRIFQVYLAIGAREDFDVTQPLTEMVKTLDRLDDKTKTEKIEDLSKQVKEKIDEALKDKPSEEIKLGSKQLTRDELRVLIREYEEHLIKENGNKEKAMARLVEGNARGKKSAEIIARLEEIKIEIKENGLAENKIEKMAIDLVIEENLLVAELKEKLPDEKAEAISKMTTEVTMNEIVKGIGEINKEEVTGQVLKKVKEIDIQKNDLETIEELVIEEVIGRVAEKKIEIEANKVAVEMLKRLKDEGIVISERKVDENNLTERIETQISEVWKGKRESLSESLVVEVANASKVNDENSLLRISQIVKEGEIQIREHTRNNFALRQEAKMAELRGEIIETVNKADSTISPAVVREYGRLVSSFYRVPLSEYQKSAVESVEKVHGPGKAKVAWGYTEAYLGMLTDPNIVQNTEKLNKILDKYPQFEGMVNGIEKARTVNGLARTLQKSEVMQGLLGSQKFAQITGFIDNPFGYFGQKLLTSEGVKAFIGKIGGQELVTGLTNIFSKGGGTAEMLMAAGKSILAKLGGTAATTAVAGGAATAGGTAIAAATGPPGWIAAAAIAVISVAKKIFGKIKDLFGGLFESLGIDKKALDLFGGLKSWMRNNLGGIFGKAGEALLGVAEMPLQLVEMLSMVAIGTVVALIVPLFFIGFFVYQMLQSNQVSTLVPPVGMGAGEEGTSSTIPPYLLTDCMSSPACAVIDYLRYKKGITNVNTGNVNQAASYVQEWVNPPVGFDKGYFNTIMTANTASWTYFQCLGFSFSIDKELASLGEEIDGLVDENDSTPGCEPVTIENAGAGDHIMYMGPHILELSVFRPDDGSGIISDVNGDRQGMLRNMHKGANGSGDSIRDFLISKKNQYSRFKILRCR
ncbi:MAG: hypothetical protein WC596_03545 [Candidatus Shapirobacteria bacterium]